MHTALILVALLAPTERRPPPPPIGDAVERAGLLVRAIREDKPEIAKPFFFPRSEFPEVKGIKDPDKYFRHLMKVYLGDVRLMRKQLKHPDKIELVSFKLGWTKRWVKKWKEANRKPYYATYKSRLVVRDGDRERTLRMRVMISWKGKWYVTHLIRK